MSGMVVAGLNASTTRLALPSCSDENSQMIPPMWVNGKTRAWRSSASSWTRSLMETAAAATVPSVCRAPLGSAVVPDV